MSTHEKPRAPMKERDNDNLANRRARVQARSSEPAARPEPSVNMDELRELIALFASAGFSVELAEPWTRNAHTVTFVCTRS